MSTTRLRNRLIYVLRTLSSDAVLEDTTTSQLAYLLCTSPDRARLIAELTARNPGVADLLMALEADELRAKLEIELLGG